MYSAAGTRCRLWCPTRASADLPPAKSGADMRVLVIEDEQLLADAVARGLTREGFAVDVAHDGVDGLHQARETPYDVIVCDVMLPGLDGLQIVRQMRAAEVWTPVLMLTARDADADITAALDIGADDYLPKPF